MSPTTARAANTRSHDIGTIFGRERVRSCFSAFFAAEIPSLVGLRGLVAEAGQVQHTVETEQPDARAPVFGQLSQSREHFLQCGSRQGGDPADLGGHGILAQVG